MLARLSAFVIWALVAATAVFWGLRLWAHAPAAPAYAVPVGDAAAARGDLTRLLGSAPASAVAATATPEAASRFRLLGVVAPKDSTGPAGAHGVALIAVDGKIAKAYAVGSQLDGDLVLRSVSLRTASIGSTQGAPVITLELPPLAAAATGTLPGGIGARAVPMVTPPPVMPATMPQPVAQLPPPQPAIQQPITPVPRPDANAATQ